MNNQKIVDSINKLFPPSNNKYPICFERDNMIVVSGETTFKDEPIVIEGFKDTIIDSLVIDYYGEFRGNYPWVNEKLKKYLKDNGLSYEWENPACIIIYKD